MPPRGGAGGRSSSQPESVLEGLQTVYTDIARLNFASDAAQHQPFIQALMKGITDYTHEQQGMKAQQAAQMAQRTAGAMGGMSGGMSGGMGGGLGGGMGGPPGPPPAQGSQGLGVGNPDEIRRMLAGSGTAA